MKAEMGGDVSEKVRLGLGVKIPAAVKMLKDGVEGRSSGAAGIKVIKRKPGSRESLTSLEPGKDKGKSVNPQQEVDLILKAVWKARMKGRA